MHARRGTRLLLAATCAVATMSCEDVAPRQAAGFGPERLAHVAIGMSRADLLEAMGAPLQEQVVPEDRDASALWYAEPGARWIMGEYRSNVRGYECVVWLKNGRLAGARVFNAGATSLCQCKAAACPSSWATPCFPFKATEKKRAG